MSNFTFKHYEETLNNALKKGYKISPLKDYDLNHDKHILMRHDVDFTIENAYNISLIENKLNINSTYFIRLHSKFYNPLNIDNYKMIEYLIKNGHEIGLHFEPDFYKYFNKNSIEYLNKEILTLENLFDIRIFGSATHEPSRCGYLVNNDNIKQTNLKYEAYLIDGFKYISDSGARWREGCMSEWINNEKTNKLYINTHPLWWFNNTPLENY